MLTKLIIGLLATAATSFALAAVDINKASEADLDGIKGIGPGTSRTILEERKKGEFKDWADLISRVKGIGDSRAAKLSAEGLTVGGAGYKAGSAPMKDTKSAGKDKPTKDVKATPKDKMAPAAKAEAAATATATAAQK